MRGELSNEDVSVLPLAALRGVFSGVVEDQVTFVNATRIAEELGVDVTLTKEAESPNHRSLVTLRAVYPDGDALTVSGTVTGIAQVEKVVEVHGRSFDLRAEGVNLLLEYEDRPGVMGVVGTLLGKVGINIEAAQISQTSDGEDAVMILRVDRPVDPRCWSRSAPRCARRSSARWTSADSAGATPPSRVASTGDPTSSR